MRKYRTGGFSLPFGKGSLTDMIKNTNFLYIFVAWNVFAYSAYKWYERKKVKDKEKWQNMSPTQKYLSLMTKPDDKVTVMKFKGLQHVDTVATDADTFLEPEAKQEEPEGNATGL